MVTMTTPLGLKPAQEKTYTDYLTKASHDFAIHVDILNLDHTPIRSLTDVTGMMLDGQVNLQRDQPVARSATFSFADADHALHLDPDSPWQGAYFADRMIRVRHQVTVPGLGQITATPFVGPIVKVSRDGEVVNVECQDKACLALTGGPPVKVGKGMNAIDAIRRIMAQGAGENRFRLPNATTGWASRNIHKPYATGWHNEASPWLVCQRIANQLNAQLLYTSDGYLEVRPWPSQIAVHATGESITSLPQVDFDSTAVVNIVRVAGTVAPPQRSAKAKKAKPDSELPTTKITAVAVAGPRHPLSPARLGRNGVNRYLPTIIEDATYKSLAQARALAAQTLDNGLRLTTGVSFDMVPLFHLDVGDLIVAQTEMGRVVVRLQEASIPLSISGDMTVGAQRRVSKPVHARIHTTRRVIPPKKKPHKGKHPRHHRHG